MSLDWKGPQVLKKAQQAQVDGINRTMAQSVEHAKRNHDWQNRTGTLEGSISIAEFGHRTQTGAEGLWGSRDVVYALTHELGDPSRGIPARPYLRPAADATYGNLAANIQSSFRRL